MEKSNIYANNKPEYPTNKLMCVPKRQMRWDAIEQSVWRQQLFILHNTAAFKQHASHLQQIVVLSVLLLKGRFQNLKSWHLAGSRCSANYVYCHLLYLFNVLLLCLGRQSAVCSGHQHLNIISQKSVSSNLQSNLFKMNVAGCHFREDLTMTHFSSFTTRLHSQIMTRFHFHAFFPPTGPLWSAGSTLNQKNPFVFLQSQKIKIASTER